MKSLFSWASFLTLLFYLISCNPSGDNVEDPGMGIGCQVDTSVVTCKTPPHTANQCCAFPAFRSGHCADLERDTSKFCAYLPREVDNCIGGLEYHQTDDFCQLPFDWFSWQTFIAVNWPADSDGQASTTKQIGEDPSANRVWEFYPTKSDVFPNDLGSPETCPVEGIRSVLEFSREGDGVPLVFTDINIAEASGNALVDKNLNFTLYDVRMNEEEMKYIDSTHLNTWEGQLQFTGRVDFPTGSYESGAEGATEIKVSWRLLDPERDDVSRFFHTYVDLRVPGSYTKSGSPICRDSVLVGMVGMHINRKVQFSGGDTDLWIWSTFEHVDNAPTCPTPTNCDPEEKTYSYYDPSCTNTSLINKPPAKGDGYIWNDTPSENFPQYASDYANECDGQKVGTQVNRLTPVTPGAQRTNTWWQDQLKQQTNPVWGNYKLIATQWAAPLDGESVYIPKRLINTTLETYAQLDTVGGNCMNCHHFATLAANDSISANMSFFLSIPKKPGTK